MMIAKLTIVDTHNLVNAWVDYGSITIVDGIENPLIIGWPPFTAGVTISVEASTT